MNASVPTPITPLPRKDIAQRVNGHYFWDFDRHCWVWIREDWYERVGWIGQSGAIN